MPTPKEVLADPNFKQLPLPEKRKVLGTLDPKFSKLPLAEQNKVFGEEDLGIGQKFARTGPGRFLGGVGAGAMSTLFHTGNLLFPDITGKGGKGIEDPRIKELMTPPAGGLGKAGFMAEQAAEFFAPIPGAAKLKAIKGIGGALARSGVEALKSGVIGTAQTGSVKEGAKTGALAGGVGLVGEAVAPLAKRAAADVYKSALRPKEVLKETEKLAMVERGLGRGGGRAFGFNQQSVEELETAIGVKKGLLGPLLTNPASPYSRRTIPIDDLLGPVDQEIQRLKAALSKTEYAGLVKLRNEFATKLGYKPGVPPKNLYNWSTGHVTNVPAVPAQVNTTVAEAQEFKQAVDHYLKTNVYNKPLKEVGMKTRLRLPARHGAQMAIEKAIPEEAVRKLNFAIHRDILLKSSMEKAMAKNPNWVNDWAVFALGAGAEEVLTGAGKFAPAVVVGAIARMAARNPKIMARLGIALEKGAGIPASTLPRIVTTGTVMGRPEQQGQPGQQ